MGIAHITTIQPARLSDAIGATISRSPWLLPLIACLAVVATRAYLPTCVDVSALITWAERLLDGARPYVDFVEVNPPGSILLYTPGVALARAVGLRPEVTVEIVQILLMGLSLTLCRLILTRGRLLDGHDQPLLLAAAIFILGVMPTDTFAQREHVGIVAILPVLCIALVEIAGGKATVAMKLAAGVLAGLSLIAKPHFGLLLAATWMSLIVARWRMTPAQRLRGMLGLQWIVAGATFAAYIALTWIAYPAFYSDALPKIAIAYLGWYNEPERILRTPVLPVAAISFIILNRQYRSDGLSAPTLLLSGLALVGVAIFFLQGRAWPYQALPALTLVCLAFAWETTRAHVSWRKSRDLLAVAIALPVIAFVWNLDRQERRLDKIVAAVTQAHPAPTMLAIAEDISVGQPLVRRVNGTWAHSVTHLWVAYGAISQLRKATASANRRARLTVYLEEEIADLARSIGQGKPDIILGQIGWSERQEMDWLEWARAQPALATALSDYRSIARIDDVEILARVDSARGRPSTAASR